MSESLTPYANVHPNFEHAPCAVPLPRTPELGHIPLVIFYSFSMAEYAMHAQLSHFRDSRYVEGTDRRSHDATGALIQGVAQWWRSRSSLDRVCRAR